MLFNYCCILHVIANYAFCWKWHQVHLICIIWSFIKEKSIISCPWQNNSSSLSFIAHILAFCSHSLYCDNIFVKRSKPLVCFAHKGINPFDEIKNILTITLSFSHQLSVALFYHLFMFGPVLFLVKIF